MINTEDSSAQHASSILGSMGPFTLRWYPTLPPSFSSAPLSPPSGYPGQAITLNGTNFTGATRVLFNGVPASFAFGTNANFADLQLIATVPPDATTGPITIETPHGNVTTTTNFTVLALPRIAIQSAPGTNLLELSWPLTTGFNPQRSDALGSLAQWTALSSFVSTRLTNGIRVVIVTNGGPDRFFRLYRP